MFIIALKHLAHLAFHDNNNYESNSSHIIVVSMYVLAYRSQDYSIRFVVDDILH